MANDLNLCQFIGRLGADPEVRYTQSNVAIASFSIAVSKSWKNEQGEKREKTEWINIVAYRGIAQVVGDFLKKGSKIYVAGAMQTRKWQAQDGTDRYTTEIVVKDLQMLDGKSQGGQQQNPASNQHGSHLNHQAQYAQQQNQRQVQQPMNGMPDDEFDDDIPFN